MRLTDLDALEEWIATQEGYVAGHRKVGAKWDNARKVLRELRQALARIEVQSRAKVVWWLNNSTAESVPICLTCNAISGKVYQEKQPSPSPEENESCEPLSES